MAIGIIAPGGMRSDRRRGTGVPLRTALLRAAVGAVAIACWSQQEAYADPCVLATGNTQVTIGEPTPVCLVTNSLVWNVSELLVYGSYSQVVIIPDADDFSRFSVKGSWQTSINGGDYDDDGVDIDPILTTYGDDVGIHVESNGKFSFQKAFRRLGQAKTFPVFTAIITVDEGEVTGISWDDGCHFCTDKCEPNTYGYDGVLTEGSGEDCYLDDADCTESDGDGVSSLCQLTVYVVWTGTDSKGNYFTSFSKRLSSYAGASLDNYIDEVAGTYEVIDEV